MNDEPALGLALIGCGGFGEFCLRSFAKMSEVRIAAVADVRRAAADRLARVFAVQAHHDPAEIMTREDVDIVHIATPPSTHHQLAMAALRAGKHCLCEKPLATNLDHADEMLSQAAEEGLVLPVNFVLRYNAVAEAVKAIIRSGVLGMPLSAQLTNCASDTPLGKDHWFWDKQVSGGIFIEHGVHFFDLYSYWFGPGEVASAAGEVRGDTGQEDRVTCTVRHESGVLASHYHGFDQILPMDRTDHRIVFEMGDVRVCGWIPLTMTVDAAVNEDSLAELTRIMSGCGVEVGEELNADGGRVFGRGKPRAVTQRVSISYTPESDKQAVYAESVRRLLADQVAFIRDGTHTRTVAETNGRNALAMACRAADLARG